MACYQSDVKETKGRLIDEIRSAKLNIPEGIHFQSVFKKGVFYQSDVKQRGDLSMISDMQN